MCDIWKDNKNLKQLNENDVRGLITALKKFRTQVVLMSGGEALLNSNFFTLCEILKKEGIAITLLSTGLTLKKNAEQILKYINDVIISIDGDELLHDAIRNIPGAFNKLREGVQHIKSLNPQFRITGRTVIHKLNFRAWDKIIDSAKEIGLDQISFLPADVSSHAFNRDTLWDAARQADVLIEQSELDELRIIINNLAKTYAADFEKRHIAESPQKLMNIYTHYSAVYGLNPFPYKKCNAPWVSTVIEADGTVRPCFFHESIGNIRNGSLDDIINSKDAITFRKNLDIQKDGTCNKCVCYLNLPPGVNPAIIN
jgi:MoaA/NifB/PqqE/SkfB family radical SAM enzyme